MFDLQYISEPSWSTERNELILRGRITLGDFSEAFESSLSYWSQADYELQWLAAAKRIERGETNSAFIVDMYDPNKVPFLIWWPIWRREKRIYIHNQLLLFKNLLVDFDTTNPYIHIGERRTKSEDGEIISEWQVVIEDIQCFITSRATPSV
jgi:CdiI N-terminal domain